jgi:hypothetical protein
MIYTIRLLILFALVLCGAYAEHRAAEMLTDDGVHLKPVMVQPDEEDERVEQKRREINLSADVVNLNH